jgi:leucyl/phenylalanyl-tRNA--protein transferase
MEPGTLVAAYRTGLFPMPFGRRRVGWWSPDPRGVLPLDRLVVSRSLRRSVRRFEVRFDTCFTEVMTACADPHRRHGWITPTFVAAYRRLHELGFAHSVECFDDEGRLVGGLYGVRSGALFAGESMFHRATDASKVALVHLVEAMQEHGLWLLDTQWSTPHLASLGVVEVSRPRYLDLLAEAARP